MPWVSRRDVTALQSSLDRALQALHNAQAMCAASQRIAAELTRALRDLAHPPESGIKDQERPPLPTPAHDDISEAIDLKAGFDKGLARHLRTWARTEQLSGKTDVDIVNAILHWQSATEWDGDPTETPSTLW